MAAGGLVRFAHVAREVAETVLPSSRSSSRTYIPQRSEQFGVGTDSATFKAADSQPVDTKERRGTARPHA
jgi:hypothetical protein